MSDVHPAGVVGPLDRALRPATLEDLEVIAHAELALFPDEAWSIKMLAEEIGHPDRRYVVAAEGPRARGPLLGYAGIMVAGDVADLHTIGSLREGTGVGRDLLAWCEDAARTAGAARMLLEVREDNDRARAFYTRAGYAEIGRRPGYYRIRGRSIDGIVMERDLRDPA